MIPERLVNWVALLGLLAVPLWAVVVDEPFTITLVTRAVILAIAAVGLNIALESAGLSALVMRCSSASAVTQWASWPIMRRPSHR